jgi:hypothetical protein
MRTPIGRLRREPPQPGEILQVDRVDPDVRRVSMNPGSNPERNMGATSIRGFTSAIVGVDVATGYAICKGAKDKKDPKVTVGQLVDQWIGRWRNLKTYQADK